MNKTVIACIAVVLIVAAGALWYTRTPSERQPDSGASSWGSYVYTCDKGLEFVMEPAEDMTRITIRPVPDMHYPPVSVLAESPTDTGRRYRGAEFEFHGRGEGVTLYAIGDEVLYTCAPQPKPDEPPFNWGD